MKLAPQRALLPEYERSADSITEIQVRTVLQHAWAEIEHDIQYKSASVIPAEIRRRFMSLAGMLEIADRESQAIQDADKRLSWAEARRRPAFTRSTIMARSNSANPPGIWNSARRAGVLVSTACW